MEVRALRAFVAVAEAGTVTAGADELGLGQPAVSRQIQQLERRLRLSLFHREDGRLHLTAAGRELLTAARATLVQVDDLAGHARALAAGRLDHLRVVSTGTTRDDVLAPWLATWGPEAPMPTIAERPADQMFAMLAGEADLVVSPTVPPRSLSSCVVADLPLWACVAPGHPWARRRRIGLTDLLDEDLLLLTPDFHGRRRLDQVLDDADLAVEPLAEFGSPVVAQAVAASGRGVCVLTDDPRFGLVPLAIVDPSGRRLEIRLHAAWDPRHHAAAVIADLASDLRRFTHERYGVGPSGSGDGESS